MGVVYLGERMEQFSQQVAIKILHPHLFPSIADAAIEREGQVLAALDHPGIVRMLDLGVSETGLRYIVMEYVDGIRIDEYCDLHRLSVRRRIEILLEMLAAIEYAHRHLVIHADLKPANTLVTAEGKSRLLDFGVATVLSGQLANQDGSAKYTELYASPEQRAGERLTVASDIYSAGLIAQIILTGQPPRPIAIGVGASDVESQSTATSARSLKGLPRTSIEQIAASRDTTSDGFIASIRGDVEAILAKALLVDPRERFQSMQEMCDEFRRHLMGYPIHARPAGWVTRTRKWVLRNKLAASFALVFLLVAIFSVVGVVYQATNAAHKREIALTRLHDQVRLTDVLAGELYSSVHGLQGADKAQDALLKSARETIDTLAADEAKDPELSAELAQEYEKLARLELSRSPQTAEANRESIDELDRGLNMLSRLPANDPAFSEARQRIPELAHLRDEAMRRAAH